MRQKFRRKCKQKFTYFFHARVLKKLAVVDVVCDSGKYSLGAEH